jgi:hypothetical protein
MAKLISAVGISEMSRNPLLIPFLFLPCFHFRERVWILLETHHHFMDYQVKFIEMKVPLKFSPKCLVTKQHLKKVVL